jgi:DNA-binding transcriptional LysR family regulator
MRRNDEETIAVNARYAVAADDGNAYLAAGLAGMGILWLPRYMAEPHAARGELTPLLQDWKIDPCRCTSPTHKTATSAPSCAPSWRG